MESGEITIKQWWEKNQDAILKAGLEALRLMVLAAIPFLLDRIPGLDIPLEIQASLVVLLKFVDKYLHTKGKEENNDLLKKGLTRF